MVNKNMTAEDYIDYLYDDNEDFFTNIDYTLPESYAYLDAKIPYNSGQKVYRYFWKCFIPTLAYVGKHFTPRGG